MIAIDPPDRHRPEPQRLCQPRPAGQPLYLDKSLYRENMWVGFMRDEKAYECAPGFFVDISPKGEHLRHGFFTTPLPG